MWNKSLEGGRLPCACVPRRIRNEACRARVRRQRSGWISTAVRAQLHRHLPEVTRSGTETLILQLCPSTLEFSLHFRAERTVHPSRRLRTGDITRRIIVAVSSVTCSTHGTWIYACMANNLAWNWGFSFSPVVSDWTQWVIPSQVMTFVWFLHLDDQLLVLYASMLCLKSSDDYFDINLQS